MSVSFKTALPAEINAMSAAVDALTREEPSRIHKDPAWASIVHSLYGEIGHRTSVDQLIERDHGRGEPRLWRLDPPGCGCTDCLVGNSKPIDEASERELFDARAGVLVNSSGHHVHVAASVGYKRI